MSIEPIVVEDDKLRAAIAKLRRARRARRSRQLSRRGPLEIEFTDDEAQQPAIEDATSEVDDAPVVKFIQKILIDAISAGASDIHFEPYEKFYRIRYRIDGDAARDRAAAARDQGQGRLAHQGHLASSTSPRSACRRTAA